MWEGGIERRRRRIEGCGRKVEGEEEEKVVQRGVREGEEKD